jgi:hypothetical protein
MGNAGMGWLLTVGWLVLGAYLLVLLAVSAVLGAVSAVKARLQQLSAWTHLAHTQEVDHS